MTRVATLEEAPDRVVTTQLTLGTSHLRLYEVLYLLHSLITCAKLSPTCYNTITLHTENIYLVIETDPLDNSNSPSLAASKSCQSLVRAQLTCSSLTLLSVTA